MTLKDARKIIGQHLEHQTATGISGVATYHSGEKLLVFFTDRSLAEKFLADKIAPELLPAIELHSGLPASEEEDPVRPRSLYRRFLNFLHQVFAKKEDLQPTLEIKQNIDSDWKGRMGCFLSLTDGDYGILTAEHIFTNPQPSAKNDVQVRIDDDEYLMGKSFKFTNLGTGGVKFADCAIVKPDLTLVNLKPLTGMTNDFVPKASIAKTKEQTVKNFISPHTSGNVSCVDLKFYPEPLNPSLVLDQHILIDGQGFGEAGHSGTIIVMANNHPNGFFKAGDSLGIYMFVFAGSRFHAVSPIHACLSELKEASAKIS